MNQGESNQFDPIKIQNANRRPRPNRSKSCLIVLHCPGRFSDQALAYNCSGRYARTLLRLGTAAHRTAPVPGRRSVILNRTPPVRKPRNARPPHPASSASVVAATFVSLCGRGQPRAGCARQGPRPSSGAETRFHAMPPPDSTHRHQRPLHHVFEGKRHGRHARTLLRPGSAALLTRARRALGNQTSRSIRGSPNKPNESTPIQANPA